MSIVQIAAMARAASVQLAGVAGEIKNAGLAQIASGLQENSDRIVSANKQDLALAGEQNLAKPLLKRLRFDEGKIADVCAGLASLMKLAEPVGRTIEATELDDDLELYKVSCPIGVVGVIFESRPDALVQISSLCLKSGNAVLLKGGSEAANTNQVLADIISKAACDAGVPAGWLGLLESRADVAQMLGLDEDVDLIVPRGSNAFVRHIMQNTTIPVLGHADGICHVYVDSDADIEMAVEIAVDSKCQYCAVCNAMETLLVHADIAEAFLPRAKAAFEQRDVELRGCGRTVKVIDIEEVGEEDWKTEYLDYVLSIKVVGSSDEAIEHINKYGSGHTDVIVTANKATASGFLKYVDSADVFWNCSSRFSDGFRFGLGAEVGISTNKIHARGPVGLEGLLTYKWHLLGKGQTVAEYSGAGGKKFTHKKLEKRYEL